MNKVKHLMKRIIMKIKSYTLSTRIISVGYAKQQIISCWENDKKIEWGEKLDRPKCLHQNLEKRILEARELPKSCQQGIDCVRIGTS